MLKYCTVLKINERINFLDPPIYSKCSSILIYITIDLVCHTVFLHFFVILLVMFCIVIPTLFILFYVLVVNQKLLFYRNTLSLSLSATHTHTHTHTHIHTFYHHGQTYMSTNKTVNVEYDYVSYHILHFGSHYLMLHMLEKLPQGMWGVA